MNTDQAVTLAIGAVPALVAYLSLRAGRGTRIAEAVKNQAAGEESISKIALSMVQEVRTREAKLQERVDLFQTRLDEQVQLTGNWRSFGIAAARMLRAADLKIPDPVLYGVRLPGDFHQPSSPAPGA